MKPAQYGPQQIALASAEGDIFWDLPPFITYLAGTSIGTTIYVANPSTEDRQYSMIAKLTDAEGSLLLEESVTVYDYAWFTVKAGQYTRLHAELAYNFSNAVLTIGLIEKSTDTQVDSVYTYLAAPTAAQIPPGFPLPPGTTPPSGGITIAGVDFSQLLMMMMFIPIMGMMAGAFAEKEEEGRKQLPAGEQRQLPLGRG